MLWRTMSTTGERSDLRAPVCGQAGHHRLGAGQWRAWETPAVADMQRRIALDLWYVEHWSLTLDLTILARTVAEVARRTSAY